MTIWTWLAFGPSAQAIEPSCIVTWEALQAGDRSTPLGGRVLASEALAVVDDGETVRPLLGLPTACDLGADGPRGEVVGDRLVAFDPEAPAVSWYALAGGAWSEVDRFDGPFPRQALDGFGDGFVAGADLLAVVSRDVPGLDGYVDVLRQDVGTWVEDHSFPYDSVFRPTHWIVGEHLRVAGGPFAVWDRTGGSWTERSPPLPAGFSDGWLRDGSAFDGTTLVSGLDDGASTTGWVAVHRWNGGGWDVEAVLEQYPALGVWEGYQGELVVSGNLAAAIWVRVPFADTGAVTTDDHNELHVWRRTMTGWALVDTFPSPRNGDGLGALALQGHTLLAGAAEPGLPRDEAPGAAYGAVYVFDLPVVDADGDGEDELTDPDDLDPNVYSGSETGDTGGGATDTASGDTGGDTATPTDSGAPPASDDPKADGCGCGGAVPSSFWAALLGVAALRRRRVARGR